VVPAFVDLKTPPEAAPTMTVEKSDSTASISLMRPAMLAGPMLRHWKSASRLADV
jgi:hypothetical protein